MTAQVEGDDVISFLFHGATWITRDRFDACSVPGFKGGDTYYRVLQVAISFILFPQAQHHNPRPARGEERKEAARRASTWERRTTWPGWTRSWGKEF